MVTADIYFNTELPADALKDLLHGADCVLFSVSPSGPLTGISDNPA